MNYEEIKADLEQKIETMKKEKRNLQNRISYYKHKDNWIKVFELKPIVEALDDKIIKFGATRSFVAWQVVYEMFPERFPGEAEGTLHQKLMNEYLQECGY